METVTEPETEISRDELLESAHEIDNERLVDEEAESSEGGKEEKPETKIDQEKPEVAKPEIEKPEAKGERQRDPVTGKFVPAPEPKGQEPLVKVESAFTKAQKEAVRKDRSWQSIEAEKAQVRQQAEELRQEKQRLAATGAYRARDKAGFTADDYFRAAQTFQQDGDAENALKAYQAGQGIVQYEQQYHLQAQVHGYQQAFTQDMERTIHDHQELADPSTKESQEVQKVLEEFPEIYYLRGGFKKAHDLAKLRLDAGSASEYKNKAEKLEEEIARLTKSRTPTKGGPNTPGEPKKFDNLSEKEQREQLIRAAEEADMSGERFEI